MQSDLYCFASMDIFTILPRSWTKVSIIAGASNVTQADVRRMAEELAVGYCERRSHVRTQHGAEGILWPANYERCYQGFGRLLRG